MEENFSGMMGSQFQLGSRIVIPTVSLLFIALSNTEVFLDCCAVKHIKAYFAFSVDANSLGKMYGFTKANQNTFNKALLTLCVLKVDQTF